MNARFFIALFVPMTIFVVGCSTKQTVPVQFLDETARYRALKDSVFRFDPQSPFSEDTSVRYHGLNWYPPDPAFCMQSKLYRYHSPEQVIILGTKGEERRMVRYGYFLIPFDGRQFVLNVYKTSTPDPLHPYQTDEPLSVWFTDETNGNETYPVGRYIDVGEEYQDPNTLYSVNFNNAYNPYCAYSTRYSCAIPRKEDHLPFPVRAGEKKYHP